METRPTDYHGIALWHQLTGSYPYYVRDLQQQAAADNAPLDALYRSMLGKHRWVCVSDLDAQHPFHRVYEREVLVKEN